MATDRRRRFSKRHLLGGGVAVAVVVATFVFVLPRIADYRDVWRDVKTLSWTEVALLLGATLLNLVTFAPPWMAALPGLRFRQAFVVTQASTASTYVAPAGIAVGMALSFAMLRAWGFASSAVGLAVAVTGVWNQLAMLAFPTVALALLALSGDAHTALDTIAAAGLAILVVIVASFAAGLSSPGLARRVGDVAARIVSWGLRLIRKEPVGWNGDAFVRFRNRTNRLLRSRWHVLTLATLAGQLTVFLVLLVSLRVLGVSGSEVSAVEAFAAGPHDCSRGLRGRPGGRRRGGARLSRDDGRAHAGDRPSCRGDLEAPPPGLSSDRRRWVITSRGPHEDTRGGGSIRAATAANIATRARAGALGRPGLRP
jgi:uncharacterized membrane protein YbhN (UPF0104 family)